MPLPDELIAAINPIAQSWTAAYESVRTERDDLQARLTIALQDREDAYTRIGQLEEELAACRGGTTPATRLGAYLQVAGRNPFGVPLGCQRLFDDGSPASFQTSAGALMLPDTRIPMVSTKHRLDTTNTVLDGLLRTCPNDTIVMFQHEPERSSKGIDPAAWVSMQLRSLLLAEARRQAGQSIEVAPCFTGWVGDPTNSAGNRDAFLDAWLRPLLGHVRLVLWDPYWWADKDGNAIAGIRQLMAELDLRWGIAEIGWDAETAVVKAGILPASATAPQVASKLQSLTTSERDRIDRTTRDRIDADLTAATDPDGPGRAAEVIALFNADGAWGAGDRHYRLDGSVARPLSLEAYRQRLAA